MFERILMVGVVVLLVFAECTGCIAEESMAGSQEALQVTVFKPPA